jgi:selenocysteine-specific elongation factor
VIIGTAGHVDHGKTTLVKALTGVDTDRLKEEKARGISIELGYAYTSQPSGERLGFIDVPGHERLVHTMVAGAAGIDFVLLVVAADDGIMPQTREHLAVLELLGIGAGAVAITKADRVDFERLSAVRAQVAASLAGSRLEGSALFAVNATDAGDRGLIELREHLNTAARARPLRAPEGLFRLAVDRVFTLAGHGTVVAGTVIRGEVRTGDLVVIMPREQPARVRSLHAQNQAAERAVAGERCALNLTGIEREQVTRGDWLADPALLRATSRIDVRLRLLPDSPASLAAWSTVHAHLGTSRTLAHVVPLEDPTIAPGQSTRAQLVFAQPVCALPGDRIILRDAQAAHTIGGALVLDPYAPERRRRTAQRQRYLDALEHLAAGDGTERLLQEAPFGVTTAHLAQLTGVAPVNLALPEGVRSLRLQGQELWIPDARWAALRGRVLAVLRDFHQQAAEEPGMDSARLRRRACAEMPHALWRLLLDELLAEGCIARRGVWIHLPEHIASVSPADDALAVRLRPLLVDGRFDPPWVRALAERLREPETRVREVLRKEAQRGAVYQVVPDLFYDAERVGELAEVVRQIAAGHGAVSAANYRDALGLGRKRAIQILEFFDRVGYTRRVRDAHVVRGGHPWRDAL